MTVIRTSLPPGVARKNPFNLVYVASIQHLGQLPPAPGSVFARYDTAVHGIRAGIVDVRTKVYVDGLTTLATLIPKFAPPSENNTAAYIAFMSEWLGIGPDDEIDLSTASLCVAWAKGQIQQEVGHAPDGADWYSDDQYEEAAQLALPPSNASA